MSFHRKDGDIDLTFFSHDRKQAGEHYREVIDNLYAEGEAIFERRPIAKL